MSETFLNGKVTLLRGDCLELLPTLEENSIDSCVTDPPYFLTSIVKRFGSDGAAPCQEGSDGRFKRLSGGFMQKRWDAPDAPAIDPCFANWMAGFIDGEGCFHVHKKKVNNCETYDCQFSINLRADDKPILAEMQRQLGGIGSLADSNAAYVGDSGSAARFFYTEKADADDRLGSKHPTVKPIDLMQYLVRLVTPKGGLVLDPFGGTGTTGEAAFREGMAAILVEREPEYQADIVKRMGLCLAGPDERRANSVKQEGIESTPLFGGAG